MTSEDGRMNPEVKEDVIRQLLDPEAKQGKLSLRSDIEPGDGLGGVCCLELVCQSAIKAGVIPPAQYVPVHEAKTTAVWIYGRPGDSSSAYLPKSVREYAGLYSSDPTFDFGGLKDRQGKSYYLTWSDLNDGLRLTFPQIADMVRHFF